MQADKVEGGGGLLIHVEDHGNPYGPPILFIHGFSQCRLCWNKQINSPLADSHRLVTMDLRGHGRSEKPRDVYGDSALWADDVAAVIKALDLDRPVLCGWSYGGTVICDYLRHHGEDAIGGINLVGAVSKLGDPVIPYLGEPFTSIIPGFFSDDVEESSATLQRFMRICVAAEPTPEDFYFFLGYNMIVPPYVRYGLFARSLDNDDLLPGLKAPVLITHGEDDAVVLLSMGEHNKTLISQASMSVYPGIGHAPFWENPARFNAELNDFVRTARGGE